jgi:hypothetical protein
MTKVMGRGKGHLGDQRAGWEVLCHVLFLSFAGQRRAEKGCPQHVRPALAHYNGYVTHAMWILAGTLPLAHALAPEDANSFDPALVFVGSGFRYGLRLSTRSDTSHRSSNLQQVANTSSNISCSCCLRALMLLLFQGSSKAQDA